MPLLVAPDGAGVDAASGMTFAADKDAVLLAPGQADEALTLAWAGPGGATITKTLTFRADTYAVDVTVDASGAGGYELLMGESFGSLTSRKDKGYGHVGQVSLVDDSEDLEADKTYAGAAGTAGWTGIADKYFMAALVVPEGGLNAVLRKGVSDWGYVAAAGKGGAARKYVMYAGPKDYDVLGSVGYSLTAAVDFGWFSFIAKPLFVSLKFFFGLVGNYGWAIIIITFIIKLAFAPLTHKQQKSMKRMQGLQPMINELKEKHKGDPQRMNREMMELYKKHKVNPLGGCLPMLVQIPVFIALYNVLNNAIELRGAPFALWLTDLSVKDPYYILPVAMGLSMFVMQKMTPTTMDKTQNRIMMLMPVILTVMFINLPSGLVLYFTVSNLLSMAQQFYINRYSKA
jgi:YidC/Oxa1 family membrane protein insertase